MPRLSDVVAALDRLYDPTGAEDWDAVGLVCGDPGAEVRKVLFAVDPTNVVVNEAISWGAHLVVTHHPLLLRPVHGVAATTAKGRIVHQLLTHGIGLHVAHTNADRADPGVSDALAAALGLTDLRPLVSRPAPPLDKLVVFVPEPDSERVIDALAAVGAGTIGDYVRCAWKSSGVGTFQPGPGANPTIGQPGVVENVAEHRVEMVVPRSRRDSILATLDAVHPYEEPAFDIYELAALPGSAGLGRIGRLATPESLAAFTQRVARALPRTAAGVRAAGDREQVVTTVAVCGGAGDSLLAVVRSAGVDAYVTADLRHHPASAELENNHLPGDGRPLALVDVAHWASEWPWLEDAAARLVAELQATGTTVETRVSTTPTDPWTLHQTPEEASSP